jgi:hypothetical protein
VPTSFTITTHHSFGDDDSERTARQRAKAEQAYETVLNLKDRLDLTQAVHADLSRGLEGLRLAIQRISRT